jgi:hypothetical protein
VHSPGAKKDFDLQVVREAIHTTPLLLVELDNCFELKHGAEICPSFMASFAGLPAPDYFNRSFCIFEVFAAVESSTQDGEQKVLVWGPAVKDYYSCPWLAQMQMAGENIVNSREGHCRWPAEKELIDAFIESNIGYEELDKLVGTAIAKACLVADSPQYGHRLSMSWKSVCLALCFFLLVLGVSGVLFASFFGIL